MRKIESDEVGGRFSLLIVLDGLREVADGLVVLPQPGVQLLVLLAVHVVGEFLYLPCLHVHPGNLFYVGVRLLIEFDCLIVPARGLVILGSVEIGVLEVYPVEFLRYLD